MKTCWIFSYLCSIWLATIFPVTAAKAADWCRRAGSILEDANYCTAALTGRRRGGQQLKRQETPSKPIAIFHDANSNINHYHSQQHDDAAVLLVNRVKAWPPWPLSLLERNDEDDDGAAAKDEIVTAGNTYPSNAALFWAYFKERTRIGIRQCKEACSALYFHLPPALPPFVLLASIPQRVITSTEPDVIVTRNVIPLFSNPLARNMALGGLGLAVMSWAHMELHRKRKLTPLLQESVSKVFLPPFLPQEEPEIVDALESSSPLAVEHHQGEANVKNSLEEKSIIEETYDNLLSPKLRKHLADLYESAPRPDRSFQSFWMEWKRSRAIRKIEEAKIRRSTIFDELVALQAIKRKTERLKRSSWGSKAKKEEHQPTTMGYALVTGASQGIGRAIAVELARWGIPTILVARDVDKLISLAYDLEACYGVKCCVLQADLSQKDSAEKIHKTTSDSGLVIDILVNNAGIAQEGLSVDTDTSDLERMMMLNTMTYAKLSCLYGNDMKKRKRGRILMVSSMAGLTSAAPNTAFYGATKAFGKSLSFSMAKELEEYGVGVTCLMPGAVKTEFRQRSGMSKALCWYLPKYPRSAEQVAHLGVASVLDGDTQVIPGWQNRFFSHIMKPILPQRIETICVQTAFSPLRIPRIFRRKQQEDGETDREEKTKTIEYSPGDGPAGAHYDLKPRYSMQPAPRLLKIPIEEPEVSTNPEESKTSTVAEQKEEPDENNGTSSTLLETEKGASRDGEEENELGRTSLDGLQERDTPTEKNDRPRDQISSKMETNELDDKLKKTRTGKSKTKSPDRSRLSPQLGPIDLLSQESSELEKEYAMPHETLVMPHLPPAQID